MATTGAYKKISGFVFNIGNTLISLIKVLLHSKSGLGLKAETSGRCVVLGNGPSLSKSLDLHLEFFKNTTLFCVNSFSVSPYYEQLKPSYYVMLDPGIWQGNGELMAQAIDCISKKTTWPMTVVLPRSARNYPLVKTLTESNNRLTVRYINYTVFKGFNKIAYFLFRKNLAMPQSQNVLVASVFLALNVGFKEVVMVGADHSWHEQLIVNDDNVVCLKQIHFHDDEKQLKVVPFVKAPHVAETFRMDEAFHAWAKVFDGHRKMNEYADYLGARVLNASEYSYVDAYPRKKIESL